MRDVCLSVLLAAIAVSALLPNLTFPFFDPDETRYAEIAREMLSSGDFIVPKRWGVPYFDKPPLLYWLTAASFAVFGISENAARLVSVTAALGTVLATFWLGRSTVGVWVSWVGAALQLFCIGFLISARFLFTDCLFALLTTTTLLAGFVANRNREFSLRYWVIAAVACGLGALTKGPVVVVLCLPPLWLSWRLTPYGRRISLANWLIFSAIAGTITIPWYATMAVKHPEFIENFLVTHHWERFTTGLSHDEPWWFLIPVLFVGMLPCSCLFPVVATIMFRPASDDFRDRRPDIGFLLIAAAWILTFFSISSCKLPPYVLPAVPLLCLVTASGLSIALSGQVRTPFVDYVREWSPRDLCLIALVAVVTAAFVDSQMLPNSFGARRIGYVMVSLAGGIIVAILSLATNRARLIRWILAAVYLLAVLLFGIWEVTPAIAWGRSSVRQVRKLCDNLQDVGTPVVCFALTYEADSFAFYLRPRGVHSFEPHDVPGALSALKSHSKTLLVSNVAHSERLFASLPQSMRIIEAGRHNHIAVWHCEHEKYDDITRFDSK